MDNKNVKLTKNYYLVSCHNNALKNMKQIVQYRSKEGATKYSLKKEVLLIGDS